MLEPSKAAGLLSTQQVSLPIPTAILDEMEELLLEWIEQGTSALLGAPGSIRLVRLGAKCVSEDFAWPAAVLDDLVYWVDRYLARDALFDPVAVVDLIGEAGVIRAEPRSGAIPRPSRSS